MSQLPYRKMLKQLHPHPKDACIQFDEPTHKYTIHGDASYISVTTFIKPLFEEFDPDAVIASMMKSRKWPSSKYFGMSPTDIKDAWKLAGTEASSAGTKLHADIEAFYNGESVVNDSTEFQYFKAFAAQCKLKPYRAEWIVFDDERKLAGTIDMVFECADGTLAIYDWKRAKSIEKANAWNKYGKHPSIEHLPDTNYWHYALQLNLYKFILEQNYGKTVSSLVLVRLHPVAATFECVAVCDLQDEIRSLF